MVFGALGRCQFGGSWIDRGQGIPNFIQLFCSLLTIKISSTVRDIFPTIVPIIMHTGGVGRGHPLGDP